MSADLSTAASASEIAAEAGAEGIDLNDLITSGMGLLGVAVGGILQWLLSERTAAREAKARRADATDAKESEARKGTYIRAFPSLKVALHLEEFAFKCAQTISDLADPDTPHHYIPPVEDWPSDIVWAHLGASTEARVRDFVKSVELERSYINGDLHESYSDAESSMIIERAAGRIGFRSWTIACEIRNAAELPAFAFPEHGWNYVETLDRARGRPKPPSEDDL